MKGGKAQLFKKVVRGLYPHHPPCERLVVNLMFYAIAALACNRMKAVQILSPPDECQSWTMPTRLRQVVRPPAASRPRAAARGQPTRPPPNTRLRASARKNCRCRPAPALD